MCRICETAEPEATSLRVFAAGSLRPAFDRIADHWPGPVDIRYANAGVLAGAILAGESADVFASASPHEPERLAGLGVARATEAFASNHLVVAVPVDSDIRGVEALGEPGVRVVIEVPGIPLGDYTAQLLGRLGDELERAVRRNVVVQGDNVDAVSAAVYDGRTDAAILYATDVAASGGRLRAIEPASSVAVRATYVICVLRDAPHATDAQAWMDLTLGPVGRAALDAAGFGRELS